MSILATLSNKDKDAAAISLGYAAKRAPRYGCNFNTPCLAHAYTDA